MNLRMQFMEKGYRAAEEGGLEREVVKPSLGSLLGI